MPELVLDWKKYQEAAIEAAAEGIVMLKNEGGALPLKQGTRVALFGRMQANYYKSGTGSGGMVNVSHVVDIREGLASSPALTLDPELMDIYDEWEKENTGYELRRLCQNLDRFLETEERALRNVEKEEHREALENMSSDVMEMMRVFFGLDGEELAEFLTFSEARKTAYLEGVMQNA